MQPFFIVGHPRSGTTLLRFMLSSHPRLYVPEETGFIPAVVLPDQRQRPLSLGETQKLFERLGQHNPRWRALVSDVPAFYANLPEPSAAFILDALYRQVIAPHQAGRWGDKTPLYVRHIPALHEIFPQAQFIHVLRDGRDAALSARRKWGYGYQDLTYLLRQWVENVTLGRRDGLPLGGSRYLEVHYETLVTAPQATLEEVCRFLGESFDAQMLAHTDLAQKIITSPAGHTEVLQPVTTDSVERWVREMSPFEQKLSQQIAGPLLHELGYAVAPLSPLTPGEKVRYTALQLRYRLVAALRQFLYRTGWLTINRKKRRR